MILAIADTHAAIWYLFSDSRLGTAASAFIDNTMAQGDHIGVSAISLAEMVYLIEKGRIPSTALTDLKIATSNPKAVLRHVPFDQAVAMRMATVSRQDVPDLPDRAIAATALILGVPLLVVMEKYARRRSRQSGSSTHRRRALPYCASFKLSTLIVSPSRMPVTSTSKSSSFFDVLIASRALRLPAESKATNFWSQVKIP